MLVVQSVPVLFQNGRNFIGGKRFSVDFRMLDVIIVGNTAVLGHLLMIGTEEEVCLIAVAQVRCPHGVLKVAGTLSVIISSAILVVESETAPSLLLAFTANMALKSSSPVTLSPQLFSVMLVIGE